MNTRVGNVEIDGVIEKFGVPGKVKEWWSFVQSLA
jgi:hypothetical protein